MSSQINITKLSQENEKDHYVLFYEIDNSYDIIQIDKCEELNVEKNTVKVFYPRLKKYYEEKIIYIGTQQKCNKKCKKYVARQSTQVSSTEDDDKQSEKTPVQSRNKLITVKDSKGILDRELEKFRNLNSQKRQRSLSPVNENTNISKNNIRNGENNENLTSSEYKKIKCEIENLRTEINDHFNKLKELITSSQNQQANDVQSTNELWYDDINLLDFGASNIQKYISKLMDKLYTEEEMAEKAVYIKYRVPNGKKNEYWELVKDKAARKCLDVAKKIRKN
ncbi:unnamed protein product [Brachionus calyciflorus]|uniref:Uncharacterized protein n=1 Tax=Brachionus calyciflorus TaxID=104777 RepID=A0A814AVE4_9BILA|nr:unnamed protein product [Brachionus calyciflorus]